MKVAAFTQGYNIPSARFRVRQYIPALANLGVKVDEFYPKFSSYPPTCRWCRPFWASTVLIERLFYTTKSYHYDITLLQREFISTFYTLEGFTKSPRVLDVDDATFLYRGGTFARKLALSSSVIICGNNFLANWYRRWKKNIFVVPTAIDTNRYKPSLKNNHPDNVIIGWIGTSGNYKYLYSIESALRNVLIRHPNTRLHIVSDVSPKFRIVPPDRMTFHTWSKDSEANLLGSFDIGLMPLEDDLWAQGKCSYKMLQYMAVGIPVVVSPVGMNREVLDQSSCGFGVNKEHEWIEALDALIFDDTLRRKLGNNGRCCVESNYSIDVLAPKIADALRAA